MNNWGIPLEIETLVRSRDRECVYCHIEFNKAGTGSGASWEHIINDIKITTAENIALCCRSCNSSKGAKSLRVWFSKDYCVKRNINESTVADIVRVHISKYGY